MPKGNFADNGTAEYSPYVDIMRAMPFTLFARGTFGGGTIKIQISPDGDITKATDLAGISLTSDGFKVVPLMQGVYHIVFSGATSPDLNWWFQ